jgi:signal transduction histidine kinase
MTGDRPTRTTPPARFSLRWRLPLLIAGLIAVVVATFLAAAYREVQADLVRAAMSRGQAAADELGGLFGQSSQLRLNEIRQVASKPVVVRFLEEPTDTTREAARTGLAALTTTGPQVIDLWNDAGVRVLTLATPAKAGDVLPAGPPPSAAGVGELRRFGSGVFSEAVAEVQSPGSRDDSPDGDVHRGWLVVRRTVGAAPTADVLNRLVGADAIIKVGNQRGGLWTDLSRIVDAPHVDLTRAGPAEERASNGVRYVGGLAPIRSTPWSIWVAFPDTAVLEPAHAFLRRMLVASLVFLVLGAAVGGLVSSRITSPLLALTDASESIAAGEYSSRVPVNRRDEIGRLSAAFNAMTEQVDRAHRDLAERVSERTAGLEAARAELEQRVAELAIVNRELEAFSYSVSHDLRAPLRHITGFAMMLDQSAGESLDANGRRFLATIATAATRMGRLIDDLLSFSRVGRTELARSRVDLNDLRRQARQEVERDINGRMVDWRLHDLPTVHGDPALLRLVLVNLLSNAVKYSAPRSRAEIEVGAVDGDAETTIFVRDNGVGFDMQYVDKLFGVFQRLHGSDEFEGTGIGLANVRRIVQRHGGRTWAEGRMDEGATFYFSLPKESLP